MKNRGNWRKWSGIALVTLVLIVVWTWKSTDSSGSVAPPSEKAADTVTVSLGAAPASRAAGTQEASKEFARVSTEVANSLPTLAVLREEARKDPHLTPPVLLNAGAELGRLVRLIQDHPELKRNGAEFYRKCSSRDELPTSIRALCYSNLTTLSNLLGDDQYLNGASVTTEIRGLAEKLPPSFR